MSDTQASKVKQYRRSCIFCGSTAPLTREHIFPSSWRTDLGISDAANGDNRREYARLNNDNEVTLRKNEDLFAVIVKCVCAQCNNTWMNDLDGAVKPWVMNPLEQSACDRSTFRRWAIKVAILRGYLENPATVPLGDPQRLLEGDPLPEWRIFIGATAAAEHRHVYCGVGPIVEGRGRPVGTTLVTWTLGRSLVVALRVHNETGGPADNNPWSRSFLRYNREQGILVRLVPDGEAPVPSVATLPFLTEDAIMQLALYFTPHPISPIAPEMRELNDRIAAVIERNDAALADQH